jgi:thiol-disulfide isomerase/thioredoxin
MKAHWLHIFIVGLPLAGCNRPAPTAVPATPPAATTAQGGSATDAKPGDTVEPGVNDTAAAPGTSGAAAPPTTPAQLTDEEKQAVLEKTQELLVSGIETIQQGKEAEGYKLLAESGVEARKLLGSGGSLEPQEKNLVAGALYNAACAQARGGKADEAMALLQESVQLGLHNEEMLKQDADLAPLRERDDFKELLSKISEAAAAAAVEEAKKMLAKGQTFDFDFELPDTEGKPVKLADYKGKVTIVDLWGTWCPPCRMEVPHFIELHKKYQEQGLEIVGINYERVPEAEVNATVAQFVKDNGITYRCVIGNEATMNMVPDLQGYPTTLFLDRTGKVRGVAVGYHPMAFLEAVVMELLAESPPEAKSDGS